MSASERFAAEQRTFSEAPGGPQNRAEIDMKKNSTGRRIKITNYLISFMNSETEYELKSEINSLFPHFFFIQ